MKTQTNTVKPHPFSDISAMLGRSVVVVVGGMC